MEKEKKRYKKPEIKTENIEDANATSMGGGGGGGKTCNGNTAGGRKDSAGASCTILLT